MNVTDFIRRIEQQQKEQDFIYHSVAVRYGLSDTGMWVLYNVYAAADTVTRQELCRQCFFPKQTVSKHRHHAAHRKRLYDAGGHPLHPQPEENSPDGQERGACRKNRRQLIEAEKRAYAALTPEEPQAYLAMTTRLTAALREETEKL